MLKQPQKDNIEYSDDVNDLSKLGYGVLSTSKSPFDAVAKMKSSDNHSPLIANVEKNRTEKTLKRMAIYRHLCFGFNAFVKNIWLKGFKPTKR